MRRAGGCHMGHGERGRAIGWRERRARDRTRGAIAVRRSIASSGGRAPCAVRASRDASTFSHIRAMRPACGLVTSVSAHGSQDV
eukprot:805523-Prymnesium_polylepis.2